MTKLYSGQRFGMLLVEGISGRSKNGGNLIWRCKCDCGNYKDVLSTSLRVGDTKSCGCLQRKLSSERLKKHGHTKHGSVSGTYASWACMISRCKNVNNPQYPNYGGRGITVCKKWNSFDEFLKDMGEKPNGKSIDRINNDGNYSPDNCRWATPKEQANNRRPRIKNNQTNNIEEI